MTASGSDRYPSRGFFHQGVLSFALTHGAASHRTAEYCVRYPRAGGVEVQSAPLQTHCWQRAFTFRAQPGTADQLPFPVRSGPVGHRFCR